MISGEIIFIGVCLVLVIIFTGLCIYAVCQTYRINKTNEFMVDVRAVPVATVITNPMHRDVEIDHEHSIV